MYRDEKTPPFGTTPLAMHQDVQIYVGTDGKFCARINQKWVWLASLSALKKRIAGYSAPLPALMVSEAGNVYPPHAVEVIEVTPEGHVRVRNKHGNVSIKHGWGEMAMFADDEARSLLSEKAARIADLHGDYNETIKRLKGEGKLIPVSPGSFRERRAATTAAEIEGSPPDERND